MSKLLVSVACLLAGLLGNVPALVSAQPAVFAAAPAAGRLVQPLPAAWRFRQTGQEAWHPATVPGCVHTDLLAAGLIPDPLYRDNERRLQWISKTDWEYETIFQVAPAVLGRTHQELVFKGLDTYADVTLNGVVVLHADNMFREWRADVRPQLRAGDNHLRIRFRSPLNEVAALPATYGYPLYATNDQQAMAVVGDPAGPVLSPYTRKAPYQYGWDWGPRLLTAGVWQPAQLEAWNDTRLTDLRVEQQRLGPDAADLRVTATYTADAPGPATLLVTTTDPAGRPGPQLTVPVLLAPGRHPLTAALTLPQPQRWYPVGYGPQPLYTVAAQLLRNGRALDEARRRVGLRTLEVRRQPDEFGKSFEFVVNGIPVFAKGANWIPADIFPTRVTPARYRQLLTAARDCHMNMVRVWGGGIYESDGFYDLCDELGLLVWQDFMFACTFYPGNPEFMQNVREEATQQVRRLRHHPSLAIWVGNNENEVAWQDWNIPALIGTQHQKQVWGDYLRLFNDLLPSVLQAEDSTRLYWPSSPSARYEDLASRQRNGDMHYWAVWAGTDPLSAYEQQQPRFMSEYGFQSFPELQSVRQFAAPADLSLDSPVMREHQRSEAGTPRLLDYLRRDYREPKDLASFLYVSQVLQAEAIKLAAEHLRRSRPRTMGSLYWQLNDCWGGASWSSIDYYGRWKALQYYARRFYAPVLLSVHEEGEQVRCYVVSDELAARPARLLVRTLDFAGHVLFEQSQPLRVEPLTSRAYLTLPRAALLAGRAAGQVVLSAELLPPAGPALATATHYFAAPKDLVLTHPVIRTIWRPLSDSTWQLTLHSAALARAVQLVLPAATGMLSDNYFDLLPGQATTITLHGGPPKPGAWQRELQVRSLADSF